MIGVTVVDPPFWAMHPYACDTLLFEDITYSAPPTSPNTDGIDPDSCSNVVIRNFTTLHCGDDAIAIKSGKNAEGREFGMPSYNILVEGKLCGYRNMHFAIFILFVIILTSLYVYFPCAFVGN